MLQKKETKWLSPIGHPVFVEIGWPVPLKRSGCINTEKRAWGHLPNECILGLLALDRAARRNRVYTQKRPGWTPSKAPFCFVYCQTNLTTGQHICKKN